jgi:hypothetical protein
VTGRDERGGPERPATGADRRGDAAEHESGREAQRRAAEARRRKRRAAVFGDVLPDGTRDERGDGWGDREGVTSDDWLRRQVPPHHG